MPIIFVDLVRDSSLPHKPGLAASLADGLASVLGKDPERTWVRLKYVEPGEYAEGGGGPGPEVMPVFVRLVLARLPDMDQRQRLASEIAGKVGELLGRPYQNVHIIFEPEATGRVAFGGKLVL